MVMITCDGMMARKFRGTPYVLCICHIGTAQLGVLATQADVLGQREPSLHRVMSLAARAIFVVQATSAASLRPCRNRATNYTVQ